MPIKRQTLSTFFFVPVTNLYQFIAIYEETDSKAEDSLEIEIPVQFHEFHELYVVSIINFHVIQIIYFELLFFLLRIFCATSIVGFIITRKMFFIYLFMIFLWKNSKVKIIQKNNIKHQFI